MSAGRRGFARNLSSSLFQLALSFVSSFLLYRIFVRSLGAPATGVWVLVATLGDMLALLELGVGTGVIKLASEASGRGDAGGVVALLRTAFRFGAVSAVTALVSTAALSAGLVTWFSISPELAPTARMALLIVGVDVAVTLASAPFRLALQSTHRYDVVNWLYAARWLVRFVVLWAGLGRWPSLAYIAAVGLVCNSAANAGSALAALRRVPEVKAALRRGEVGTWPRRVAGYSAWVVASMVGSRLAYSMDALIVGGFLGVREVAHYYAAWRLVEAVRSIGQAAVPFFLPMASERSAAGQGDTISTYFYQGVRLVIAITYPLCAVALGAADSLLSLWLGPEFASVKVILWVLLAPQVVIMTVYVAGPIAYGIGRQKELVLYGLTASAVNLGVSLLLVRWFGMLGVALGSAITLTVCAFVNLRFYPRLIGFSVRVYLRIVARGMALLAAAVALLRAGRPYLGDAAHLAVAVAIAPLVTIAFLAWELTRAERSEAGAFVLAYLGLRRRPEGRGADT